ncbi:helix-turn-helix domain-containing protein [Fodinibius salsisoli]|uniref:Helix-turn-helix transcriptional regulator n=1 Tax=Fodinibius salsisoli TaxID=2820877 RepID=A0ABT3PSK9_9BACT|nr:helix-turn-helix transcriptional regulator [Fodinibius salsisoli]MCW9708843.1 helix-turn-helix transcriptional regulator [Fodinibius salsisoli]
MTDLKKCIANRLKEARASAGLSQNQVANFLGLKRPSISEIEAGRRKVSAEELVKFSDIYNVRLNWLACKESELNNDIKEKLKLAAREASKIKSDDLDKIIKILTAFKSE